MADGIIPGGIAAADGWIGTGRSDTVLHTDSAPDGWIGTGRSDGTIRTGFVGDGWIGTGRSDGVIHPGFSVPDPLLPAADFA
jgi:hypothetical protein